MPARPAAPKPKPKPRSGIFLSKDPDEAGAELELRIVATTAGLPRVCTIKKCRRRKRCFGAYHHPMLPCIEQHEGLFRARFTRALAHLGWSMDDEEEAMGSGQ